MRHATSAHPIYTYMDGIAKSLSNDMLAQPDTFFRLL